MKIKYKIILFQELILHFMTGEMIKQPHVNEEYSFVKKSSLFQKDILQEYQKKET